MKDTSNVRKKQLFIVAVVAMVAVVAFVGIAVIGNNGDEMKMADMMNSSSAQTNSTTSSGVDTNSME